MAAVSMGGSGACIWGGRGQSVCGMCTHMHTLHTQRDRQADRQTDRQTDTHTHTHTHTHTQTHTTEESLLSSIYTFPNKHTYQAVYIHRTIGATCTPYTFNTIQLE